MSGRCGGSWGGGRAQGEQGWPVNPAARRHPLGLTAHRFAVAVPDRDAWLVKPSGIPACSSSSPCLMRAAAHALA